MGTSQNHGGSKPGSGLIPPHADATPGVPIPDPMPDRFRRFRTSMGGFVHSGSAEIRDRALGRYAREASGGADVGVRKFGAAARAGGAGIAALRTLSLGTSGAVPQTAAQRSLREALGKPVDVAAQILAQAIAPNNESRDRIVVAFEEAICVALEGEATLQASLITDEFLSSVLLEYLTEVVFQDVWIEAGDATNGAVSHTQLAERENSMRQTVRAMIDAEIAVLGAPQLNAMSPDQISAFQLSVVRSVLTIWEGYGE
jgi:hypothetical protein